MDADIVRRMKAEEADLIRKLNAVRAFLVAYGGGEDRGAASVGVAAPKIVAPSPAKVTASARERFPLDRFSEYGGSVVRMAITCVMAQPVRPVATRRLVEMIEVAGVEIRGTDKVNALSALLARSIDLRSIGRRGWTLANDDSDHGQEDGHLPEDNEPPATSSLGGSDTEKSGDHKSPLFS